MSQKLSLFTLLTPNRLTISVPLFLFCLLFTGGKKVFSQSLFYKFPYKVRPNDNLRKIYKRFVKQGNKMSVIDPMVIHLLENNPHIKSWKSPRPGKIIDLYIKKEVSKFHEIYQYIEIQNKLEKATY